MDSLEGLLYGLSLALTPELMLAALVGALAGTVIGVLPGLGPVAGAALILPLTFTYEPAVGLIMIAGVYLGAQYGGSITSILLNIPGDASAIVATFDGYEMTKRGRGGAALSITALGSFIAGTLALMILLFTIPFVMGIALSFGAAEFFALTAGGLLVLARISGGSLGSGLFPMVLGVGLATIGTEPTQSFQRFTFGNLDLSLGVALASVAVGLYGISEIMYMLEGKSGIVKAKRVGFRELIPTREELKRAVFPWVRGSFLGFLFGLLPGPSATLSTFTSYKLEKTLSKRREEFGAGAVEGLSGPEAANNSAAIGGMVPLMLLGLPFSATLALMISAMQVQGIQPGPLLMTHHPEVFWAVIAAMFVANIMLLILNLPLVGVWVRVLGTPMHILIPIIVVLAAIGSYSLNNNLIDVHIMLIMGMIGYVMRKLDFSLASLLVGLVLGPLIEKYFIQGMYQSRGDLAFIVSSPISIGIWSLAAVVLLAGFITPSIRRKSKTLDTVAALREDD
ncbi:tripartite tricarboxylate transporter TctA [Pseudarthrobacter sulfonivorans]|uniref:Tripartite tricarboxylate transporter TctA n=1 Tax=Pseudarthrobacter sulfonivorans TaxID=121292 RepID=A0A0U3QEJ1_9MICC|nr:tripartite tricarboxylate transporter permease [Pseudarthrobacter sulfonivorans]ALV39931.1 tripartite tricarboxylate transporter TctA [Pseudarthrobacter sulfonivorans]